MGLAQITQKAIEDIAKLAQGVDRAEVALEALKDSKLTPKKVKKLEALLKKVRAPKVRTPKVCAPRVCTPRVCAPKVCVPSATASPLKLVDGHQAVVGKITVNGQQLDTLLSEGSFNKTRRNQIAYAEKLGYRMATREEHRAYVEGLLAKEENDTINDAEKNALNTYRQRRVRDTAGGIVVDGQRVYDHDTVRDDLGSPNYGALFVRASAESK